MELEEYLKEYKALTLDIMERANEDGSIGYLVDERKIVLDKIIYGHFNQSDIYRICERLKITELENELNKCIKEGIANTKMKINKLRKMKNANIKYTSIGCVSPLFDKNI